jgi:hypothetical protein
LSSASGDRHTTGLLPSDAPHQPVPPFLPAPHPLSFFLDQVSHFYAQRRRMSTVAAVALPPLLRCPYTTKMGDKVTAYLSFSVVAVLILLAVRANRNDRHPMMSAFLWALAITVFVWGALVWLTSSRVITRDLASEVLPYFLSRRSNHFSPCHRQIRRVRF